MNVVREQVDKNNIPLPFETDLTSFLPSWGETEDLISQGVAISL